MIRRLAARLAALTLALLNPAAHAGDSRLLTVRYHDNVVIRVPGRPGVQAAIAFGADEHIDNVAIGDANLWQVTPNKRVNILFVKPLRARARTNLTVVTDQHSYFFDLVGAPGEPVLYMLRFTYPDPPKPAAPPPPLTGDEKAIAAGDAASAPIDPAALDFAWRAKGKAALQPTRVFDDGRDTYLTWPDKTALPAILVDDGKGNEGPVNFTEKAGTIVVEGVPARIVLRAGKDSAVLEHLISEHPGEHSPAHPAPPVMQIPPAPNISAARSPRSATP
jgi:type IV secretion system protein VirB9